MRELLFCNVPYTDNFVPDVRPTKLSRFLLLDSSEANFAKRGFTNSDPNRRNALESVGRTFIAGYNTAVSAASSTDVLESIFGVPIELRGFYSEGAAMGTAISDAIPFRKPRLDILLEALSLEYDYLIHVGVGWSLARTPWRRRAVLGKLKNLIRWLAFDGLGFNDTYFYHPNVLSGWQREKKGYARRAYDQGIGRALWFVSGGHMIKANSLISAFSFERHRDLWAGIGLAMAYAGPTTSDDLTDARDLAGQHMGAFLQGVAFACEARCRAHCIPEHAERAAHVLTGTTASEIARLVRACSNDLPTSSDDCPDYEHWRIRVSEALTK